MVFSVYHIMQIFILLLINNDNEMLNLMSPFPKPLPINTNQSPHRPPILTNPHKPQVINKKYNDKIQFKKQEKKAIPLSSYIKGPSF